MKNLNGRIKRLEETAQQQTAEKPILHLWQSGDDPNLFCGRDFGQGRDYHRSQFPKLREKYQLLVIKFVRDWRRDDGTEI